MNRLAALGFLLLALLWTGPAAAHLTPNSEVRLTFRTAEVIADVVIPQNEYAYATGAATDGSPASKAAAAGYLARNVAVTAPDGRAWQATVTEVRFETIAGPPDLGATFRLTPPAGAPVNKLRFEWHAVTREVPTHFALLVEGGDLSGKDDAGRRLIGALTAARPAVEVDSAGGSGLALIASSVRLGARHIAEGYDHLLFLLALLLPAPLLAAAGRWQGRRSVRDTVRHLALIVTGFTIGHSTTLIAAALFNARLPAAPVEAGIALSVLVSAIHAARPLFAGREPLVATGFGLVHGLAFATLVSGLGIGSSNRIEAILGFNLGIEAVQLAIVAVCLPAILWLAAEPGRARFRLAAAAGIAAAALVWLIERLLGIGLALGTVLETVLPWLFAGVAACSLIVLASALRPRKAGEQTG